MFCKTCGTKNRDGARFCESCGGVLKIAPQKAQSAQPASNPQMFTPKPQQMPPQMAPQAPHQMPAYTPQAAPQTAAENLTAASKPAKGSKKALGITALILTFILAAGAGAVTFLHFKNPEKLDEIFGKTENVLRNNEYTANLMSQSKCLMKEVMGDYFSVINTADPDGKMGVMDKKGNIVVPMEYENILPTGENGLFTVLVDVPVELEDEAALDDYETEGIEDDGPVSCYGVIDKNNKIIIKPEYLDPIKYYDGFAVAKKAELIDVLDGTCSVFDKKGKETAASNRYRTLTYPSDGVMIAEDKGGEELIVDCNGKVIAPLGGYRYAGAYTDNGLFVVYTDNDKAAVINSKGKLVFRTDYAYLTLRDEEGNSKNSKSHFFIGGNGDLIGVGTQLDEVILDEKGKAITPKKYSGIRIASPIPDQETLFVTNDDDAFRVINTKGQVIAKIERKEGAGIDIEKNCIMELSDSGVVFYDLYGNVINDVRSAADGDEVLSEAARTGTNIDSKLLDIKAPSGQNDDFIKAVVDGLSMQIAVKNQYSATVNIKDKHGAIMIPNMVYRPEEISVMMDEHYLYIAAYDMTSIDQETLDALLYGANEGLTDEEKQEVMSKLRFNNYSIRYN